MTTAILLLSGVLFLAYSNGANDNFKGVATLYGSGAASFRRALAWASVTTLAGSLLALLLAGGLVAAFSGKGLVPDAVTTRPSFLLAVSLGAAATVMLATKLGLPVSTTHALTGGLVGAGLLAANGDVRFGKLGETFVLPLMLSPVVALALTVCVYPVLSRLRRAAGVTDTTCVCVVQAYEEVVVGANGAVLFVRPGLEVMVAETTQCVRRYRGRVLGFEAGRLLDGLHFLSAGTVGFARGLNDTPKIVALMIAARALPATTGLALISVVMAIGGLINARRVAETMAKKITPLNPGQGFAANFVTSLLVAGASRLGLPVSTTHVSVGSLFGIAAVNGDARARTVLSILLAWVTTLPLAAALSMAAFLALRASGVR